MKIILRVWIVVCFIVLMVGASYATVVDFEGATPGSLTGTGYAGLTWGTSSDDSMFGLTGDWCVYDVSGYATPHSGSKYVFNWYGPNNLWLAFSSPVVFNGAWFATTNATTSASQVRVRDDDETSDWLSITGTPQFLAADFTNSTTIWVERSGNYVGGLGNALWFSMDDITYNEALHVPEPATMLLLGLGLVGLAGFRRKLQR